MLTILNTIDQWTGMAMASCPDLLLFACTFLIGQMFYTVTTFIKYNFINQQQKLRKIENRKENRESQLICITLNEGGVLISFNIDR